MLTARTRLTPNARRELLLVAAEAALRAHGPGVKVDEVAAEAQVARATIYHYFDTWDDVLAAVRIRVLSRFFEASPPDPNSPHAQAIVDQVCAFADFIGSLEGLHDALFHSDFAAVHPLPAHAQPAGRIETLIRKAQTRGMLVHLDPPAMARLIFAAAHETADAIMAGADRSAATAALRLLLSRVLAPPHPGPLQRESR